MGTVAASGQSTHLTTQTAVQEALTQATARLGDAKPTFGILFASVKQNLKIALSAASATASNVPFVGCTTAGEFTERGLTHGGIAVLLIASDELMPEVRAGWFVKTNAVNAANALCGQFEQMVRDARSKKLPYSTTLALIDGLSGAGERLVELILEKTRAYQQIVGGAAADDGEFKTTFVGTHEATGTDSAVAVHFFGAAPWGIGVGHGLRPSTKKMTVTKATGSRVFTIDGIPAFDVYRQFASQRGVTLTSKDAGPFLIGNELGVFYLDSVHHARAPLSVEADGSLVCAADIAQGATVCILDGERESMVKAARAAAEQARTKLEGRNAAAVLVFDCVCRGMILDKDFDEEIGAIRSVFPKVPICGFLTYGEIARFKGGLEGWHNATAVIAAIPA